MAIYWDEDTLVLDDEFEHSRGMINFELYKTIHGGNNVKIYQDSDIPVFRDKFESLDLYADFTVDDTIESLLKIAHELKEYKNGKSR